MAGSIKWQEGTLVTLTTTGASATSGSAVSAGTLDCRSGGNAADMLAAMFALTAQWGATTGIAANTTIADLYLVPAVDGTNYADIDPTAGASYIPATMRYGSFVSPKALSATTNYTFPTLPVELMPVLYNVYILNRSGQTISSNWTLKVAPAAVQYT